MPKTIFILCFLLAVSPLLAQAHQPVLLISVDGLRPDYVNPCDGAHQMWAVLQAGISFFGINSLELNRSQGAVGPYCL